MINKIENKFNCYLKIYEKILPSISGDETDDNAKILLENSLYLSIFTEFENFLKVMIENYVENVYESGIKITELSTPLAKTIFMNDEKKIKYIFDCKKEHEANKAFERYFTFVNNKLPKNKLEEVIHFEFLHKAKLNGYYKDIFNQILGDANFLDNLKIPTKVQFEDKSINQEYTFPASNFISEYTEEIRNEIAHGMSDFSISSRNHSFDYDLNCFKYIINMIKTKYEQYTQFSLDEEKLVNILDDF